MKNQAGKVWGHCRREAKLSILAFLHRTMATGVPPLLLQLLLLLWRLKLPAVAAANRERSASPLTVKLFSNGKIL